jgi:hypothetical protein
MDCRGFSLSLGTFTRMTMESYLKKIEEQTGMKPADFEKIARKKGLLEPGFKATPIIEWLQEDYDLGYGHSGAIYAAFRDASRPKLSTDEKVDKYFGGSKAHWRASFDKILAKANTYGDDIALDPTGTYISLTRDKKKFAIVAATGGRLDVGIKRKGEPAAVPLRSVGQMELDGYASCADNRPERGQYRAVQVAESRLLRSRLIPAHYVPVD